MPARGPVLSRPSEEIKLAGANRELAPRPSEVRAGSATRMNLQAEELVGWKKCKRRAEAEAAQSAPSCLREERTRPLRQIVRRGVYRNGADQGFLTHCPGDVSTYWPDGVFLMSFSAASFSTALRLAPEVLSAMP